MYDKSERYEGERRWAIGQLEEVEAPEQEAKLVMRMLEQWWDDQLRPGNDPWRALGWFEQLARGKALEKPRQAEFDWVQAKPGQLVVRDYVRVRADGYKGTTGQAHNGRSGPIVSIRHGDIIVRYDDGGPVPAMGARHSPHVLEKRVAR
jgi:hypothetical protein